MKISVFVMCYLLSTVTSSVVATSANTLGPISTGSNKQERVLCYKPCKVKLTGHLVTQYESYQKDVGNESFGNGENIYVLHLIDPVTVNADPASDSNLDSFQHVIEIQVSFDPTKIRIDKYIDKKVSIEGWLYEANTGHHYTDVLIHMTRIRS